MHYSVKRFSFDILIDILSLVPISSVYFIEASKYKITWDIDLIVNYFIYLLYLLKVFKYIKIHY